MDEIRVKAWLRNDENRWTTEGAKISNPETLEVIRDVLDKRGSIIVEHWFFYGSRAPDRFVFDDFDDFVEYLKTKTGAGDAISVWSMHDLCTRENTLAEGKIPDLDGAVPSNGAY